MILLYARILERGYVEGGSGYSFGLTISQSAHCLGELWNYSLRERIRLRFIDIGGGLVGFMRDARCGRLPSYGFTFGVFDCLVFDFVFIFGLYLVDAFLSFSGESTGCYHFIYEEQLLFWEFFGILTFCLGILFKSI